MRANMMKCQILLLPSLQVKNKARLFILCIRKRKKQGSVRPNDFQDNTTILCIFYCVGIYNNGAKAVTGKTAGS